MPDYITYWPIWRDLIPIPIFAGFVAIAIALCITRRRDQLPTLSGVVFSLCLFGLVTGIMTGLSREPAVGAVLPGVLGLIGGVVVYLAGTSEWRVQTAPERSTGSRRR